MKIRSRQGLDGLGRASLFGDAQPIDPLLKWSARWAVYWVQATETPRRLRAFCWIGVALAVIVKGSSGVRAVTTVFLVRVMRSAIRVWKLWTGSPSSVRPLVCLLTAEGDRLALATALSLLQRGREAAQGTAC